MEELSMWLKSIILVILFATFIDLLLPSNKFARVVKMATGLVILLAMLAPVLSILGNRVSLTDWLTEPRVPAGASLESIRSKAEQLGQNALQQSAEEWKLQLQTYVAKQVESLYPVTVSNAEVTLALENDSVKSSQSGSQPAIQSVRLYVAKRTSSVSTAGPSYIQNDASSSSNGIKPIAPVGPITIGQTASGNGQASGSNSAVQGGTDPEQQRLGREMQSQLSVWLQIPRTSVQIIWS